MPFNVSKAIAYIRRVPIAIGQYGQTVTVHYNAGKKFRDYQLAAQKLDQEYNDLNVALQGESASTEAYEKLKDAMAGARRRLADNLCTVIETWDLEASEDYDLGAIKANMSKADQKRFADVDGVGQIPIEGAWLDALPLPDEFIIAIAQGIGDDFAKGGQSGKAE